MTTRKTNHFFGEAFRFYAAMTLATVVVAIAFYGVLQYLISS